MSNHAAGSYLRHLHNPAEDDSFNIGARAKLNATDGKPSFDDSSPRFEDWSPEKQRAGYEGTLRADEKHTTNKQNADEFLALRPEFLDTEKNARLMNDTLHTMFGDCARTVEQFEAAYKVLRVSNTLDIDQAEVVKQQQQVINAQRKAAMKKRHETERLRNLSEGEMETMSLEQVREQANRQLQEQMQAVGERGGFDVA